VKKKKNPLSLIVTGINNIEEENMENMKNINETKEDKTFERVENLKSVVGAEELADLILYKMEDSLANSIIDDIERDYGIKSYENEDETLYENNNFDAGIELYDAIMKFANMGGKKEVAINHVNTIFAGEELDESGRGLGHAVKGTGDRGVKMRDDKHHAPLTNLNESINSNIKSIMDKKITKKELSKFISEQAKVIAKQLKG
jgi:hypothetical protein